MKLSELKQLIKEEMLKVVSENEKPPSKNSEDSEYKKRFDHHFRNLKTFQPEWALIPGVDRETGEFDTFSEHMMRWTLPKVEIMFEDFTEEGMSKEEALKKILGKFHQSSGWKPNRDWSENHLRQKYKF